MFTAIRPHTKVRLTLLVLAYTLPLCTLRAAEWYLEPQVTGRVEYNDNIQLRSTNEVSTTEFALKPEISFGRRTERSDLQGNVAYEPRRFSEEGLDTNDSSFNANGYYNLTRLQRINLNLNLIKDTTLESELDETGIVYDRTERQLIRINPGWRYSWDEKTFISVTLGYTGVDYADETRSGLSDYKNRSASFSVKRRFTPTTTWILSLGASRYELDDDSVRSNNQRLTLGLEHQYSERWHISAAAGARRTETEIQAGTLDCPAGTIRVPLDFPFAVGPCINPNTFQSTGFTVITNTISQDTSGALVSANMTYKMERGEIGFDLSRDITPTGRSSLIVRDRIGLNMKHRFTGLITGAFRVEWNQSQNTDNATTQVDRTLYRIVPSLSWKLARDWRFAARYRYIKLEREGALASATGNIVSFALTYNWPPYTKSR